MKESKKDKSDNKETFIKQVENYLRLSKDLEDVYEKESSMIKEGKFSTLNNLVKEKEYIASKLIECQDSLRSNMQTFTSLDKNLQEKVIERSKAFNASSKNNYRKINAVLEYSNLLVKSILQQKEKDIMPQVNYNTKGTQTKPKKDNVYMDDHI